MPWLRHQEWSMSATKRGLQTLFILAVGFSSINCASFGQKIKSWMGGGDDKKVASNPPVTSFSNQPNVTPGQERKYHRTTKDSFGEDQGLEESSGSLWRKEGQASYLFSQNNLRMMGDIINVDVEGKAADSLSAKLGIIKQNLARIENPKPANKNGQKAGDRQPAGDTQNPPQGQETAAANDEKAQAEKKFDTVP